jgi:hypothetical protein
MACVLGGLRYPSRFSSKNTHQRKQYFIDAAHGKTVGCASTIRPVEFWLQDKGY